MTTTTTAKSFAPVAPTLPLLLEEIRGWKVDQGWAEHALIWSGDLTYGMMYGGETWEPCEATAALASKPVSQVTAADLKGLRREVRKLWGRDALPALENALEEALEAAVAVGWLEADRVGSLLGRPPVP